MGYLTLKGARASTFVVPPLAPSTVKKVRLAREPVYESHMPEEANAYTQSRARSKEELCLKRRSGANGGGGRTGYDSHFPPWRVGRSGKRMFDTDVVDGNSRDVKKCLMSSPLLAWGRGGGPVEGSSV